MGELIDRGALLNGFSQLGWGPFDPFRLIENAPTVDAAPVVHARWERVTFDEHDWNRRDDGAVDEYAFEVGMHNGPMCKRCGHSWCVHCEPDGIDEPCEITVCSHCRREPIYGKRTDYCGNCGARMDADTPERGGEDNDG